jgi:hypothetical protein
MRKNTLFSVCLHRIAASQRARSGEDRSGVNLGHGIDAIRPSIMRLLCPRYLTHLMQRKSLSGMCQQRSAALAQLP